MFILIFLSIILGKYILLFYLLFVVYPEPEKQQEGVLLNDFTITAYCPCKECNGKWEGITKEGIQFSYFIKNKINVCAVDPTVIPFGSYVKYNQDVYWAKDVGSKIKGRRIDLFKKTHAEAKLFGIKTKQNVNQLK